MGLVLAMKSGDINNDKHTKVNNRVKDKIINNSKNIALHGIVFYLSIL